MRLTISIITVCFNSAKTIEETLQSVIAQDYSNIEYIVVDGGSTDETLAILQRYRQHIHTLISEPDEGIYAAMNKGIKLAKGDIVGLIHSDDYYAHPQVISRVANVFQDAQVQACYGDLIYFSTHSPHQVVRYWRSSAFKTGLFSKGWCPPHPTFFVRREVYERLGGFDCHYRMGNDVELMMRFLEKHRISSIYLPEVLVKMRLGGVSNRHVKNIIEQNRNILLAAKRLALPISVWKFVLYKLFNRLSQFMTKSGGIDPYVK